MGLGAGGPVVRCRLFVLREEGVLGKGRERQGPGCSLKVIRFA